MTPAELRVAKAAAFDRIVQILYPDGNHALEWSGDTIEEVADEVLPFLDPTKSGEEG